MLPLFRLHLKGWLFAFLTHFKSSSCWSVLTLTVFSASLSFEVLQLHQYSTLLLDAYQIYFIVSYPTDNKRRIKTKEGKRNVSLRDWLLFVVLDWPVSNFLAEWEVKLLSVQQSHVPLCIYFSVTYLHSLNPATIWTLVNTVATNTRVCVALTLARCWKSQYCFWEIVHVGWLDPMPGFEGNHKIWWQYRSSLFYASKFCFLACVWILCMHSSKCQCHFPSAKRLSNSHSILCTDFALFLPIKGQANLYLQQYCWLNSPSPLGHLAASLCCWPHC